MSELNLTVKVHPVVLFQVVDAYERRNADSHRVIGTLLGSVDKGVVEVTNCFCVPHKEHDDQVEAELSYALDLYDLNRKVNPNENVVGWWATGNEVTNHSSVIHEYYARECNNPVHLTVDTSLQGGRMGLKTYVCIPLGVPGGKTGCMFTPIPVEMTCYEPETVGIKLLQKTIGVSAPERPKTVSPMLDLAQISEASTKLQSLLELILKYVEDVIAHKQPPDNAVGRQLLDLIHSVPHMSHEQFTQMFNANNVLCIFVIFALAFCYAAELEGAESSVAAKSPEKRGIYGFGYGHGFGGLYGGHGGYYGGHGIGYPSLGYSVHAAPIVGHGGYYPYHGHGFYH